MPEFERRVLDAMRQPLEEGRITVSRAARSVVFPARFMLVAAMNPCPCGYLGGTTRPCRCTPAQVAKYRSRISGPLRDRIDLIVEVDAVPISALGNSGPSGEPSAAVRGRVAAARQRQAARNGTLNARLPVRALGRSCGLSAGGRGSLDAFAERLQLSARAYHRVLRVSRTIADLAASECVADEHLAEALQYRFVE